MGDEMLPVDGAERARTLNTSESFLVQAPAGSGKTELLTRRLLKLLAQVDEPEQILAITFTIAATAEMRGRVLDALRAAERQDKQDSEVAELARAVLEHNTARGWNLLQQPERLNILTIDAVCLTIAHETPLLSRLGGSLSPTDKPQPLYKLAARRTLARLGDEPALSDALRSLLQLRSASLFDCEALIADMLDKRDQWGRVLPFGQADVPWQEVRNKLEEPLRRLHEETVEHAQSLFAGHAELEPELMYLLSHACGNVGADSELMLLRDVTQLRHLTTVEHWQSFCHFLLTKSGKWRKRPTTETGFLSGNEGKAAKERFASLLEKLATRPELQSILRELRVLPPARYTDEESQMLGHLMLILRFAVAELLVVFAERRVVDFVQLGLAARAVLSDDGAPSELAADVAGRWKHLLVDEFQDTSRSQYELLTLLAGEWESSERGTWFLVGDPMQSIYMFRQAEVELFERTKRYGLGEGTAAVKLCPLQLQMNFRSHAGLVDRLNGIFEQVFTRRTDEENGRHYQVGFAPSSAFNQSPRPEPSVHIWPRLRSSTASPEDRVTAAEAEARQVVSIIEGHWPEVEKARRAGEEFRIAVLVRAKSHLGLITKKLRDAKIPFRAVEIEQLGERQEVRDLAALTRALQHPMDRIAWLTVLRAPWCGLTLRDLHTLCGSDEKEYGGQPVIGLLRERIPLLSEDGQERARRAHGVLEDAVRGEHRQISLAQWVERTWITLGGEACVNQAGYENARTFFTMLEEIGPDAQGFEDRMEALCAQPDPHASERCGVQLMTIHKAKGLGFDVVIVPGLERATQGDSQPMLRWIEQTRLVGPSEEVEQEFVVAPIGRRGQSSGIYQWIGKQQTRRQDDEAKRLFYVAATRAREELHLLGTAIVKTPKNGEQEVGPGDKHSLLGIAWEALRGEFERAHAEEIVAAGGVSPLQTELAFPEPSSTLRLRRLPAGWKPLVVTKPIVLEKTPHAEMARPQGSPAARAFGTVVHGLLEDLTGLVGISGDGISGEVVQEVRGWRERAFTLLRAFGQARAEAESQSAEVVNALLGVLGDATGRWILGARAGAETEVSWSAWTHHEDGGETVKTLRGDRIFYAGETPGSAGETHLWIVDYKTARAGGAGIDAFLQEEKEKYQPQLEAYAEVMRKVHGESVPVRLALYYPLLKRMVWW